MKDKSKTIIEDTLWLKGKSTEERVNEIKNEIIRELVRVASSLENKFGFSKLDADTVTLTIKDLSNSLTYKDLVNLGDEITIKVNASRTRNRNELAKCTVEKEGNVFGILFNVRYNTSSLNAGEKSKSYSLKFYLYN